MPHETPLIATIVVGLVLAFIFGAIANRLRIPPLVGYLVAGVFAGSASRRALSPISDLAAATGGNRRHPADVWRRAAFLPATDLLVGPRPSPFPAPSCQIIVATLLGAALASGSCGAGACSAGLVFGLSVSRLPAPWCCSSAHAGTQADRDGATAAWPSAG